MLLVHLSQVEPSRSVLLFYLLFLGQLLVPFMSLHVLFSVSCILLFYCSISSIGYYHNYHRHRRRHHHHHHICSWKRRQWTIQNAADTEQDRRLI